MSKEKETENEILISAKQILTIEESIGLNLELNKPTKNDRLLKKKVKLEHNLMEFLYAWTAQDPGSSHENLNWATIFKKIPEDVKYKISENVYHYLQINHLKNQKPATGFIFWTLVKGLMLDSSLAFSFSTSVANSNFNSINSNFNDTNETNEVYDLMKRIVEYNVNVFNQVQPWLISDGRLGRLIVNSAHHLLNDYADFKHDKFRQWMDWLELALNFSWLCVCSTSRFFQDEAQHIQDLPNVKEAIKCWTILCDFATSQNILYSCQSNFSNIQDRIPFNQINKEVKNENEEKPEKKDEKTEKANEKTNETEKEKANETRNTTQNEKIEIKSVWQLFRNLGIYDQIITQKNLLVNKMIKKIMVGICGNQSGRQSLVEVLILLRQKYIDQRLNWFLFFLDALNHDNIFVSPTKLWINPRLPMLCKILISNSNSEINSNVKIDPDINTNKNSKEPVLAICWLDQSVQVKEQDRDKDKSEKDEEIGTSCSDKSVVLATFKKRKQLLDHFSLYCFYFSDHFDLSFLNQENNLNQNEKQNETKNENGNGNGNAQDKKTNKNKNDMLDLLLSQHAFTKYSFVKPLLKQNKAKFALNYDQFFDQQENKNDKKNVKKTLISRLMETKTGYLLESTFVYTKSFDLQVYRPFLLVINSMAYAQILDVLKLKTFQDGNFLMRMLNDGDQFNCFVTQLTIELVLRQQYWFDPSLSRILVKFNQFITEFVFCNPTIWINPFITFTNQKEQENKTDEKKENKTDKNEKTKCDWSRVGLFTSYGFHKRAHFLEERNLRMDLEMWTDERHAKRSIILCNVLRNLLFPIYCSELVKSKKIDFFREFSEQHSKAYDKLFSWLQEGLNLFLFEQLIKINQDFVMMRKQIINFSKTFNLDPIWISLSRHCDTLFKDNQNNQNNQNNQDHYNTIQTSLNESENEKKKEKEMEKEKEREKEKENDGLKEFFKSFFKQKESFQSILEYLKDFLTSFHKIKISIIQKYALEPSQWPQDVLFLFLIYRFILAYQFDIQSQYKSFQTNQYKNRLYADLSLQPESDILKIENKQLENKPEKDNDKNEKHVEKQIVYETTIKFRLNLLNANWFESDVLSCEDAQQWLDKRREIITIQLHLLKLFPWAHDLIDQEQDQEEQEEQEREREKEKENEEKNKDMRKMEKEEVEIYLKNRKEKVGNEKHKMMMEALKNQKKI